MKDIILPKHVNPNLGDHVFRYLVTDRSVFGHYKIATGDGACWESIGFATICGAKYENNLYYSVALCSPNDNFSKKEGRKRALENMCVDQYSNKRRVFMIPQDKLDEQPAVILKLALEDYLLKANRLPKWTKGIVLFRGTPRKTVITKSENNF